MLVVGGGPVGLTASALLSRHGVRNVVVERREATQRASAAHRFPPSGGLGLNTGILDVDFLVGALARVESGVAEPGVLDDYETACRPVAVGNAEASLGNLRRLSEIQTVLGPCAGLAALESRLASLTRDERRRLEAAVERQRSHLVSDGCLPVDPRGES